MLQVSPVLLLLLWRVLRSSSNQYGVLSRAFGSNKAQLAMLRNDVTTIYYKYLPTKTLPTYVRENLILLHEAYTGAGGNSYVCTIFKDMLGWEVSSN